MNSGPTLQQGSSGADVRRVQRILVMIKLFGWEEIDGIFGPKTKGAVKSFQESEGLVEDGIVGPATWGAMPKDPNTPLVKNGDTGPVVTALQHGLHTMPAAEAPRTPARSTGSSGPRRRRPCAPTRPIRAWGPTASWGTGPGGSPPAPRARRSPRCRGSRRSEVPSYCATASGTVISRLRILPVGPFGSSSVNQMCRGYL